MENIGIPGRPWSLSRINRDLFEASSWEARSLLQEPPQVLLGRFYHTRKPYLSGSGSSVWGDHDKRLQSLHKPKLPSVDELFIIAKHTSVQV